ncbi:MAG: adenylate/guanylate cyclase domain-containing protein [Spirochaetales bacterium]|nr:adenylate/guanylate cyclase domain-containing protein [Spirochaetales bacterium]
MPINQHTSTPQKRLENLMTSRLEPGADKETIDRRIWDSFGEKWCVMFTDLSGFSRGTEKFGIIHFMQIIFESERLMLPVIEDFDGFLIKSEGDSLLVLFKRPEKALLCCKEIHKILHEYNKTKSEEEQILLCVGLGYGDILNIGFADVFGAEVNAASKLGEDTAKSWEILVTDNVKKEVEKFSGDKDLSCDFEKIDFVPPGAKVAYKVTF